MNAVLLPTAVGLAIGIALFAGMYALMRFAVRAAEPYWQIVATDVETGEQEILPRRYSAYHDADVARLIQQELHRDDSRSYSLLRQGGVR